MNLKSLLFETFFIYFELLNKDSKSLMSILNSILKTFVGDKTKKDLNKITPLIYKING